MGSGRRLNNIRRVLQRHSEVFQKRSTSIPDDSEEHWSAPKEGPGSDDYHIGSNSDNTCNGEPKVLGTVAAVPKPEWSLDYSTLTFRYLEARCFRRKAVLDPGFA